MLERHFDDVWLGGVDAAPHVKADFDGPAGQGEQAAAASTSSTCGTGCRTAGTCGPTRGCCPWPTSWWPGRTPAGATGITADDWFVTDELDDTTLVLFAVARRPRAGTAAG